jgi:predicted nucleic acid-binding Zn ribbon protein
MTAYIVCRMCGKYIPAGAATNRAYCSDECTRAYSACANCGKVFPKGKGFDGEYCTRECTIRYEILRKYGPEPVTVVAEV